MAQIHPNLDSRICREPVFPFPNHLSLGEIDRRTAMAVYCRQLQARGEKLTMAETWEWGDLNRFPRRPPIYRADPPRVA